MPLPLQNDQHFSFETSFDITVTKHGVPCFPSLAPNMFNRCSINYFEQKIACVEINSTTLVTWK